MLNRIIIMGRLARDPELRHTQSGSPVASFTLAVDRDFKDKQTGEKVTDWIDVVAWRQTGEFVSRYFTKGRMAVVEGRLQIRDWTDREGNKRRSAEVVADNVYFGDSKKDGDGGYQQGGYPQGGSYQQSGYSGGYSGGYGGPPNQGPPGYPASDYNGFQEAEEDDGDLPF
ncbi:MAG: single-stranded DNA-binding protein [Oscillospiraceae bacterium]|nr:single-stranded DNA-binding protein [Oscillospiraceae bacterium]